MQGTTAYFTLTAAAMFAQQLAMRSPAVRRAIGLPADWPDVGAAPVRTGTHPLAKYLDGNVLSSGSSTSSVAKVKDAFMTIMGTQQPDAPPPPTGAPPALLKAAAAKVLAGTPQDGQNAASSLNSVSVAKPKYKKKH